MAILRAERLILILLIVTYLIVAALFAIRTPDWQAPDEPAHYNYIAQVAENGCCPQIEEGDWQNDYQLELRAARFHPDRLDRLNTIEYEDHQPPLYYLIGSIVYKISSGSLTALRLYSVVLGAVVVLLAYGIGRQVFPERWWLALSAASLVAFLPQHVAIHASVNNDVLGEVIIALALLQTIRYLKGANVPVWQLGLIVGIGLITKTTTYFLAAVIPLAILLRWLQTRQEAESPATAYRQLAQSALLFLIPALIFGGAWWLRNIGVYGGMDFLGLATHDAVVQGQLRTDELIAQAGIGEYLNRAILTTFKSFWGMFGWLAVPMEDRFYFPILAGMILGILGGIVCLFLPRQRQEYSARPDFEKASQRNIWIILWVTLILAVLAYLYYNSEFVQFQGRYMYPGLIPFALMMALGIDTWRRLLFNRWGWSLWLTVFAFWPLALLDLHLILRVLEYWLSWAYL